MGMSKGTLIAVRVEDRGNSAVRVQQVLTDFGCSINVRLGLHDQGDDNVCSPCGTMILQLSCGSEDAKKIVKELNGIVGVKSQFIDLD
jgi:ribose 5-phosphate isomerase